MPSIAPAARLTSVIGRLLSIIVLVWLAAAPAAAQEPQTALDYLEHGNAYFGNCQYDLAIADYTRAIALDPGLVRAYNNRGNTYSITGRIEQALEDFTKAIALDPQFAPAYYNRALIYDRSAIFGYGPAIEDYTTAIALDPQLATAYLNRGIIFAKKNHLGKPSPISPKSSP